MAVYDAKDGFNQAIHNIENAPFRTKFEKDVNEMHGNYGVGCISDYDLAAAYRAFTSWNLCNYNCRKNK